MIAAPLEPVHSGAAGRRHPEFEARARRVRVLLFDVDGVFTDGGVILGSGGFESKRFHIQDGMGITLAHQAGLETGVLTGRVSEAVERRARELKMRHVVQGAGDKAPAFAALLAREGLAAEEVAFMGDDLQDLPVMIRVGLAMAPANGRVEVRDRSHMVTHAIGGSGAVREAIEAILVARGSWDGLVASYLEAG